MAKIFHVQCVCVPMCQEAMMLDALYTTATTKKFEKNKDLRESVLCPSSPFIPFKVWGVPARHVIYIFLNSPLPVFFLSLSLLCPSSSSSSPPPQKKNTQIGEFTFRFLLPVRCNAV
eukprot:TRINITY_DN8815_c2_g1_i1.p3 TRINITY_DN8815_c2_g1~~TRINITY_DN8815_c2_g1_i1.p3  ORF type:complete len:117 (+),score=1.95 TRINITY_DN8815_c2_g1_i1:442-792(+)